MSHRGGAQKTKNIFGCGSLFYGIFTMDLIGGNSNVKLISKAPFFSFSLLVRILFIKTLLGKVKQKRHKSN